ncbi:hypothetical protein VCV18_007494 [Metarhizium anisopliae]
MASDIPSTPASLTSGLSIPSEISNNSIYPLVASVRERHENNIATAMLVTVMLIQSNVERSSHHRFIAA